MRILAVLIVIALITWAGVTAALRAADAMQSASRAMVSAIDAQTLTR